MITSGYVVPAWRYGYCFNYTRGISREAFPATLKYTLDVMEKSVDHDRRSGMDRRQSSGFNIFWLIKGGRRKGFRRREDEQKRYHVDQYNAIYFTAVVVILILSTMDALLTLFLVDNGAVELNPVMDFYIKTGPYHFFATKYALTCIGVLSLLILRNKYLRPFNIRTGSLFYFIIAIFAAVVSWQFYLVNNIVV